LLKMSTLRCMVQSTPPRKRRGWPSPPRRHMGQNGRGGKLPTIIYHHNGHVCRARARTTTHSADHAAWSTTIGLSSSLAVPCMKRCGTSAAAVLPRTFRRAIDDGYLGLAFRGASCITELDDRPGHLHRVHPTVPRERSGRGPQRPHAWHALA